MVEGKYEPLKVSKQVANEAFGLGLIAEGKGLNGTEINHLQRCEHGSGSQAEQTPRPEGAEGGNSFTRAVRVGVGEEAWRGKRRSHEGDDPASTGDHGRERGGRELSQPLFSLVL